MTRLELISLAGFVLSSVGILLLNSILLPIPKLIGLALFYLGGSVLLLNVCSFQMCAALFVCGIGVTVLLFTADREHLIHPEPIDDVRVLNLFRLILAAMLGVLAYTSADLLQYWIPIRHSILLVCIWAVMMGIISLVMDGDLLFRCIYLQSLCIAFTICYIYMENSVLIFSFFAAINLLMSFGWAVLVMGSDQTSETAVEENP